MIHYNKPVVLPESLEFRFVAGRVLMFLPLFCGMAVLFWALRPPLLPYIAIKYLGGLALVMWMACTRVETERMSIERYACEDAWLVARTYRSSNTQDLLCLSAVLGIFLVLYPLLYGDIRRIVVIVWLAVPLLGGWFLRWLVWDHWIQRELRKLYTEVRLPRYD